MPNATVAPIVDPWPDLDAVPMVDVAKAAQLSAWQVRSVEKEGLVSTLEQRGPHGRFLLSKEDAIFLLIVAAAAMAAGLALIQAARVVRALPGGVPAP